MLLLLPTELLRVGIEKKKRREKEKGESCDRDCVCVCLLIVAVFWHSHVWTVWKTRFGESDGCFLGE